MRVPGPGATAARKTSACKVRRSIEVCCSPRPRMIARRAHGCRERERQGARKCAARERAANARHLIVLLTIAYIVNFLDRNDIGYAGITMNAGPRPHGQPVWLGRRYLEISYALLEVPSSLIKQKGRRAAVAESDHDHLGYRQPARPRSRSKPKSSMPSGCCSAQPRYRTLSRRGAASSPLGSRHSTARAMLA